MKRELKIKKLEPQNYDEEDSKLVEYNEYTIMAIKNDTSYDRNYDYISDIELLEGTPHFIQTVRIKHALHVNRNNIMEHFKESIEKHKILFLKIESRFEIVEEIKA
jgi:hypothetical protein